MNCLFMRPSCRPICKPKPCISPSCSSRNSSPCRRPLVCSRGCSPSPSCEPSRRKCYNKNVAVNTCVPSYESDTFSSVMRKMDKFCCGHPECLAFPVCRHTLECSACETTPKGPCYYPPCLPEPSCMPGLRFSEPSCSIPIQVPCKGKTKTCSDLCRPKFSPCLPKVRPCRPCDSSSPCSNPCVNPCKTPSTECTVCRRCYRQCKPDPCSPCSSCPICVKHVCKHVCKHGYPCSKKSCDLCSPCYSSSSCPICVKHVCKHGYPCFKKRCDPCSPCHTSCSKIVCSDPCLPCKPCKPRPCKPYPCKPYPCKPYPCKPYPCKPYPCKPYPCKPYPCKSYPCKPYLCKPHPCKVYYGKNSNPCSRGPCIIKKLYQNKFPSTGVTNYQKISIKVNQPSKSCCNQKKSTPSIKLGSASCPARALSRCQDCHKVKLKKNKNCPKTGTPCCKTNVSSCRDVFGPCPLLKLPNIKIDPTCQVVEINNNIRKKPCKIACN